MTPKAIRDAANRPWEGDDDPHLPSMHFIRPGEPIPTCVADGCGYTRLPAVEDDFCAHDRTR